MPRASRPYIRVSRCTPAALALALLMAALGSVTSCGPDVLPAFANPPPEDAGAPVDATVDDTRDSSPP